MSNNVNEVMNFDHLMEKYIKDKGQILSKYNYHTPLKEIAPIEPLIFQNDILPINNTNPNRARNYEPFYDNNNINEIEPINNNPYMKNGYDLNESQNKFITPIKPITQKNSNSYINSSIEREKAAKEEKKKKQLEYKKFLDEQIMKKKERQRIEKEKRLEEEKIFEEKFRLENEKFEQQKKPINKEYRNISNIFSEENSSPINSNNPNLILEQNKNFNNNNNNNNNNNINPEKDFQENFVNEIPNNRNLLRRTKSQPYFEVMPNNNLFQQIPNKKYQIPSPYIGFDSPLQELKENQIFQNQNNPQSQIPIEHLVSTSTQIPAQLLNPRNQNYIRPPYKTQNNYYPASRQNQNINLNYNQNQIQSQSPQQDLNNPYLTQRQYSEYPQPKLQRASSDLGLNTNISISPSNFPTCYQIPFNNNLMNSSPNVNFNNNSQNVNELLNMNINNQNYYGKIIEMFFHEQEKILESYKETIEKLKNERDEAIYRNKANEEKILALQKMQNDQELLEKNLGYFPLKNGYQKNMERTLDSIMQKNENEDYNNDINNKNFMEENRNEQNMNNINDNSNISDSKMASLITSTKFVKVNTGDDKELLETWKKEDKKENSKKNNKNNIKENNNNNINENNNQKNKFKFNGMDTNSFMEKINSINNKILEPPEEPQKYLNVNNLSLISKTQKIDEKSFTNEISNINSNKDNSNNNIINNINTEENVINTDNTNIKEDLSYLLKKEKDDSGLNNQNNNKNTNNNDNSDIEIKNKDIMLNNVHNIVMENLDNNISYSTQLKEKLERERKLKEQKNVGNTSEKEDKISYYTEVEKTKYKDYTFKQLNFSNTKNTDFNQINKIKLNPNLKNLDNNLTISSKKNQNEKNPFDNIVSLNDEEEENIVNTDVNNNTNTNKNTNDKGKSQYIDEEINEDINDIPNQDSPRNNDSQNFDIQRNTDNQNKNEEESYYSTNKKEEDIMNRMNFFDEDNLSPKIKLEKKQSEINQKFNNINYELNNSSFKDNSNLINNQINNSIPNNNINELSKNSIRPLNNFSKEKITSLNNLYDEFKKKKESHNETNNSIANKNIQNSENNNSLLNESLNTFTQNLNKKWKDLTKDDLKNMKNIRERNYNEEMSNNNNIENTTLEYDKFEDEKIFDKVNQFTKVALNELKQSELSIFNKEKTIKKYN